jgi:putative intracellular protease/amidase
VVVALRRRLANSALHPTSRRRHDLRVDCDHSRRLLAGERQGSASQTWSTSMEGKMEHRDVHLFVFDSLSDWECGYAVAGINNPQLQCHPGRYRVRTVALRQELVTTIGGLRIQPHLSLDQLTPADSGMLIIPGGTVWDEGRNGEAVEAARAFLTGGVPVAAICGATAGLARGGLLDDRRHTSNAREYLAATSYRGTGLYEDASAVTDGDLITASGTAPLDFALHIFRRLDLYTPAVLEAWYGLFKTGRPEYFAALMRAGPSGAEPV